MLHYFILYYIHIQIYIYIYVCMYVCMYIYIYTYMCHLNSGISFAGLASLDFECICQAQTPCAPHLRRIHFVSLLAEASPQAGDVKNNASETCFSNPYYKPLLKSFFFTQNSPGLRELRQAGSGLGKRAEASGLSLSGLSKRGRFKSRFWDSGQGYTVRRAAPVR